MSDTPRMDLVAGSEYELETARQIERELAAVTKERDLAKMSAAALAIDRDRLVIQRNEAQDQLKSVTAQRDALWDALRWLCWDDCSPCATAIRDCPRYLDAIESDTVTPQL